MRSGGKSLEMILHVFMKILIVCQQIGKMTQFRVGGQMTVDDQVGRFDKGGFLGELVDRNPAITEDAFLPVDESDIADA